MSTTCALRGEGGRELAEAGVEAEREGRQDHVVLVVAEVVADALGPDDEVAVREDDALGPPGAARRVEDGRHVALDRPAVGRFGCGRGHRRPLDDLVACPGRRRPSPTRTTRSIVLQSAS